jgi:hypothetical protein
MTQKSGVPRVRQHPNMELQSDRNVAGDRGRGGDLHVAGFTGAFFGDSLAVALGFASELANAVDQERVENRGMSSAAAQVVGANFHADRALSSLVGPSQLFEGIFGLIGESSSGGQYSGQGHGFLQSEGLHIFSLDRH